MMTEQEQNKEKNSTEELEQEGNVSNAVNEENNESKANEEEEQEVADETQALKNEVAELKDKYLRLYSEFENFRRRTSKERLEILKTAGEDVISSLLPVLDDFERAIKSFKDSENQDPVKEGVYLIYNKFLKTLEGKGLKAMESVGAEFNSEFHEAITQIPAPSEDLKGKVVDEVEKGYYLNEKVIRFAKVIIGA